MTIILWILIRVLKSLKNLHFDWSFSRKVYNVWPKRKEKLTRSSEMRNLANIHQKTLKCQNWYFHGILLSKVQNLGLSLKIGTLMTSFSVKLKTYDLKIYSGVMCHDNEEWCKIGRGIDLSAQNRHKEFDKFWPKHLKLSKICTLMDCFWPKHIMFELKKIQRCYVWWHWILMQNLRENWLVLSKITGGS